MKARLCADKVLTKLPHHKITNAYLKGDLLQRDSLTYLRNIVQAVIRLKALACDTNRQSGNTVGTTDLLVIPGNILSVPPSMTTVVKASMGENFIIPL